MADKVLQGVLMQVKAGIGLDVGTVDEHGCVALCSDETALGEFREGVAETARQKKVFVSGGFTYMSADSEVRDSQTVFVKDVGSEADGYCAMLAVMLANVRRFYDEKHDKNNFIKNVVMDNILPGDVYAKARELRLATDVARTVILIRVQSASDISVVDIISGLFPDKNKDFVFSISESDTVIVKELISGVEHKDIENLAASILDMLEGEHFIKAIAGIGTRFVGIKDLANSFKEAQMALEVGKVFYTEQNIINYDSLGIARLIYHLPTTLCEMFLKEVFKKGSIDSLDQETLFTIQHFFTNNLNVSETSRGLFVHRNTLVYRLEKIKKITGLDLREFEQAIVFKVALMVKKYLDANPTKY